MPYGVLKNKHQEELGRRGQRNCQKKQHSWEKGALEKEQHNHKKELGKKKKAKAINEDYEEKEAIMQC